MAHMPDIATLERSGADPTSPQIGRVRARRRDGPDVWTLEIEPVGDPPVPAKPGQFNMLTVFGVGEAPISLSGNSAAGAPLIHTIRAVGPVSAALTSLRPGAAVGLRGPFGIGWPMDEAVGRDVVIMAGGLGLAPLRPAFLQILADRTRYGQVQLLCGARSPDAILFPDQIARWRTHLDIQVDVTVDHAKSDWHGNVGVVTRLLRRAVFDPSKTIGLVCGPEIMMRSCLAALEDAGVRPEALFLSMERNMKCATGHCGHCQFGPVLICRDGPVFRYDRVAALLKYREL
jgi:NAD(P)H-flavin reductase